MKKSSLLLLLILCTSLVYPQQRPVTKTSPKPTDQPSTASGRIFGVVISDFNFLLQEPVTGNTATATSGRNSFDIRRLHLGYDHTFNKDFSARVIYDPAIMALQEAYVNWENVFSMHSLMVGMFHTSAEKTSEKYFGYRSLGQLVLDRKGFSQEFDQGISLFGKFDPLGTMYYSLAVGNGSGIAAENDKLKKLYFTFGYQLDRWSVLEIYADYENMSAGRSAVTGKLLFAMMAQKFSFGVDAFYRMNRKFAGTKDVVPAGASLFGWAEIMRAMKAVARVDVMDDDLNTSNAGYQEVYLNLGVDYSPIPEVHFMPNVAYVKNLKKGAGVEIVDYNLVRLTTAVYFR